MQIRDAQILITGANRGIGFALAQAMAKRNAHLHLAIRQPDQFKETDELLSAGARSVTLYQLDVADFDQIKKFVADFGAKIVPDILINNAGQLTGGLLEEQDPAKIVSMLNTNLIGLILLSRHFLPMMLEKKRGKIVNNASVSGRMFMPCASTYAASKAGVVAFTECLKQEVRGTGVSTLLMITPGVKTKMFDDIYDLYGGHLDLGFLSSIPAEEWATKVCRAIEEDRDSVEPSSSSAAGLFLAKHMTGVFESIIRSKFRRN